MIKTTFFSTDLRQNMGQPMARGLMALGLAAGVWALSVAASPAQARDVYWSIGVQSPGVQIGASNAPYGGYAPYAPYAPVYVQRPRPVYVQPAPVVVYPGSGYYRTPPRVVYVEPWGVPIGRDHDRRGRGGHRDHDRGYDRGHGDDGYGHDRGGRYGR